VTTSGYASFKWGLICRADPTAEEYSVHAGKRRVFENENRKRQHSIPMFPCAHLLRQRRGQRQVPGRDWTRALGPARALKAVRQNLWRGDTICRARDVLASGLIRPRLNA